MHGGKSLAGIASPQFTKGKFSKYLPERLLERYHEALDDPELLELRENVALLRARVQDLLSRVDTGESGALWRKAQELLQEFRGSDDSEEQMDLLLQLEATISDGVDDYSAWDEVLKAAGQQQKAGESERKRLVEQRHSITNEQGMVLIANISHIIRTHVTDRTVLTAIAADIARLVTHQSRGVVDL